MPQLSLPPFPDDFSMAQLDALRDLTCYVTGLLSFRKVFPKGAVDGLKRPDDQQIRRFKEGSGILDYEGAKEVLRTVYTRVFAALAADFSRHRNLRHLLDRVYPQPNNSRLEEAANFFYTYFPVNIATMPEMNRALRGVFFLYRMGERSAPGDAKPDASAEAEYVKSVLGIWNRTSGALQWLEFRLTYRAGKKGETGERHRIRGVVVPRHKYLYFLGIDEGMAKAPCQMICLCPDASKPLQKINGILLRLNTLYIISAARTVLIRVPNSDQITNIDALFEANEAAADIHSQEEDIYAREFAKLLKDIDNTVDGQTSRTLRN